MVVKGDLKIAIDDKGLEVRVTLLPRDGGSDISLETVLGLLAEKKVREGIDAEAIDKALRTASRKKGEPVSFVAAAGQLPRPPEPEGVDFEPIPIPPRLTAISRSVLEKAPPPHGYRLREEKIRKEKKVLRKQALPFLPPKEEVQVVVEKRTVREDVAINPAVTSTGFVAKGALVAHVSPGHAGREGRSVFGKLVPAARGEQGAFLFCDGLERAGHDVKAATTGFLRRGAGWADVVPYHDHVVRLAASRDGTTCLLSFEPGDPSAPIPDGDEVLAQAAKLGFAAQGLLSAAQIGELLRKAVAEGIVYTDRPLSPTSDGSATVTISPDKVSATLTLKKAHGVGKPLTLALASDAIRASKVRRYNIEAVRKDLQAFFNGPETELVDYPLAAGKPPEPGKDGGVEWIAKFLPAEDAERIRSQARARADRLSQLASLTQFPPERVESVGRVSADAPVVRVVPATIGPSGIDVFGTAVPGLRGTPPEVRLFEGLQQRRDVVYATEEGVLEKGSDGMAVLLRVRRHRDADLTVTVTDDRMKATLTFVPAAGTGSTISVDDVREQIHEAGIVKGIDEAVLSKALDSVVRGKFFKDVVIARGKLPPQGQEDRVIFHIRLATGRAVTLMDDGRADFRAQDRITHVGKGVHIATVKPPPLEGLDSWDVTGRPLPPAAGTLTSLQAGRGVSAARQPDGSLKYFADVDGELVREGSVISVLQVHTVSGDVDMSSGNVNFPGIIHVTGSVLSGFRLIAAGDIEVEETVDAAILSSEGSIIVGQGIKGEGRAILRARKDLTAPFAEHAVLLAVGDVRLKGACLRCQVKCSGKLFLDSEKGSLVGGEVRARQGVTVQNIGSPTGVRTLVCFGQDFMLKDQIDREEREIAAVARKIIELDTEMKRIVKGGSTTEPPEKALQRLRTEKAQLMKGVEQRKLRLIGMHDTFDLHVHSEVVVRGTVYPGAVVESHGRRWETTAEKNMITLFFDQVQGKVVQKI